MRPYDLVDDNQQFTRWIHAEFIAFAHIVIVRRMLGGKLRAARVNHVMALKRNEGDTSLPVRNPLEALIRYH